MASNSFESFDLKSSKEWKPYIRRFRQYMISQRVGEELYTSCLISSVSNPVYELMSSLCHPDTPEEKQFDVLVEIVANHFGSNRSVVAARYEFRKREQRPGESVTDFIHHLHLLAQPCEFHDKLEENLRDQLAAGVARDDIRQSLFIEKDLNFTRAKEIALGMEAAAKTCKIGKENIKNTVAKKNILNKKIAQSSLICSRCGRWHAEESEDCPYLQFRCNICQEKGHLAKMCPISSASSTPYLRKGKSYVQRRYRTRHTKYFGSDSDCDETKVHVKVIKKK